jgi:BlaI family penicillinase repressor
MEELTKAEEKIMMIFWKLKKAFVKDIIAELPDESKPPYNTISSVTRILAGKGYLKFKAYGKTYEYYPAVTQGYYRKLKVKKCCQLNLAIPLHHCFLLLLKKKN